MLQTQPSKNITVRYKERTNITLCQAHFQSLFLITIAQSLKPLNLLSTSVFSKGPWAFLYDGDSISFPYHIA